MAKQKYPSEKLDQYMLRLPDGMRDRIKRAAEENGRSMNAEIVATLEEKYPNADPVRELLHKAVETLELLERTPGVGANELSFANRVVDEARGLYHASQMLRGIDPPPPKRPGRRSAPSTDS